jgi:drug/metabolite transporter (DMT)-like permease
MKMKNKFQGIISLLGATLIWGSAFIAQSVGMELIGPFTFQTVRCGLAVLFLIPLTLLFDKGNLRLWKAKWMDKRLWKGGLICGLALFAAASMQQVGLVYTDAGKAGFITAMYIVLVPVLGLFLKRKPPKSAFFSVILAVVGLYLLSCMGVSRINLGDILLMGCALGYAVQITCVDSVAEGLDGMRLNCVQALVTTVLSVPFMLFTEEVNSANVLACWLPLCYAGVLSMGVAYTLQIVGQKHLEATTAALIMSLESVIAALCGWLILKETMTTTELLGCGLVFAAFILSQLPEKK